MSGYTKLVDGYWASSQIKNDETWVEIGRNEAGEITSPSGLVDQLQLEENQKAVSDWKENRQKITDSIEVEYNGIIYQGDEISQTRMARAIAAAPDEETTVNWTAKDNTVHALNKSDLKTILLDAGNQQTAIWNEGRP